MKKAQIQTNITQKKKLNKRDDCVTRYTFKNECFYVVVVLYRNKLNKQVNINTQYTEPSFVSWFWFYFFLFVLSIKVWMKIYFLHVSIDWLTGCSYPVIFFYIAFKKTHAKKNRRNSPTNRFSTFELGLKRKTTSTSKWISN